MSTHKMQIQRIKQDLVNKPFDSVDYLTLENAIDFIESDIAGELRSNISNKTYHTLSMLVFHNLEVSGSRTKIERKLDVIGQELASKGLIADNLSNNELEDALRGLYEQIKRAYEMEDSQKHIIQDYFDRYYSKESLQDRMNQPVKHTNIKFNKISNLLAAFIEENEYSLNRMQIKSLNQIYELVEEARGKEDVTIIKKEIIRPIVPPKNMYLGVYNESETYITPKTRDKIFPKNSTSQISRGVGRVLPYMISRFFRFLF